uniref:Uncharacterized protein n=1 Tax=Avena sativa TaxID=4498 RepID=A0ACD5WWR0_AVESA
MATMVPPSPPAGDEIVDDPAVEHQRSSSLTTKPCWKTTTSGGVGVLIGTILFLALLVRTQWNHLDVDYYSFLLGTGNSSVSRRGRAPSRTRSSTAPLVPIPFSCGANVTSGPSLCLRGAASAPAPSPPLSSSSSSSSAQKHYSPGVPPPWCPDYFRHIHTDLEPWRATGITQHTLARARRHAMFRLVVVSGRAYVQKYRQSYQTRDIFTQWGILQLLARYPGRVPDVEIMFATGDVIEVRASDYRDDPSAAPPLFRYCKDVTQEVAVLWPDWSFWGWPEINVRPWAPLMKDFVRENERLRWADREPYAFWKGNTVKLPVREDLYRCNNDSAAGKEWNARLFKHHWGSVSGVTEGEIKETNILDQCRYRYKIYVGGRAWSVSEKYILACDSPMLALDTNYKDFFSRGLVAGKHYWPIDHGNKCPAIKFAVDWGNAHPEEAQRMGQEGSGFVREEMDMEYVYEYMLHVLTQYAALLRYKPTVPSNGVELCPESIACPRSDREREFMMESREKYVAEHEPCTLPPPFTADEVREMALREADVRSKLLLQMEGH